MMDRYEIERMHQRDIRASLRQADPTLLEPVIEYLEAHSRNFRSGYIREIIWKYIRRYELNLDQSKRLEDVAIAYLYRPMSREFKPMCLTMARIASSEFWIRVEQLLDSENPRVQVNAYCLHPYGQGVEVGERQHLELNRLRRHLRWQHRKRSNERWNHHISSEELIEILCEPENWIIGEVVKYDEPRQVQISWSNPQRDKEFLRFDYSSMIPKTVLPTLRQVLQTGTLSVFTFDGWFYAIHVIGQLNDPGAVDILIEFLESKIDYKYHGPFKCGLELKALAVLERFGTAKAKAAVSKRRQS